MRRCSRARVSEESYFFKLSAFEQPLLELYERIRISSTPDIRRNEVVSFVKSGLKDFSVSRTTFKWGIPVPGRSQARHVRLVRCVDELHHRGGLPDDTEAIWEVLARRCAPDGQGDRPVPRRLSGRRF